MKLPCPMRTYANVTKRDHIPLACVRAHFGACFGACVKTCVVVRIGVYFGARVGHNLGKVLLNTYVGVCLGFLQGFLDTSIGGHTQRNDPMQNGALYTTNIGLRIDTSGGCVNFGALFH